MQKEQTQLRKHLMSSSSFIDMELANHLAGHDLAGHKHGPSCSHTCGHAHDDSEYDSENGQDDNSQDGNIGE